ncbi:MAG: hypothetical protein WD005_02880 [Haliea sp.]
MQTTAYADLLAKHYGQEWAVEPTEENQNLTRDALYDMAISLRNYDVRFFNAFQPVNLLEAAGADADGTVDFMEAIANSLKTACLAYATAIGTGLVLDMVHGNMPADANNWDLNAMATRGYNISCEWRIKDETFKFDFTSLAWMSKGGMILPFDTDTGLPIHPLQSQESTQP